MEFNPVYKYIKEIKEVSDIKKIAQLLSSGTWIAICAIESNPTIFVLARVY